MGLGALRSIIRPVSRTLLSTRTASAFAFASLRFPPATFSTPASELQLGHHFASFHRNLSFIPPSSAFDSLTDTRFLKRRPRPSDNPRRKRDSLKPLGPTFISLFCHSMIQEPGFCGLRYRAICLGEICT